MAVVEMVMEELHRMGLGTDGLVSLPKPVTNPQTRGNSERGVLERRKKGKRTVVISPADLSARMLKLEKDARA